MNFEMLEIFDRLEKFEFLKKKLNKFLINRFLFDNSKSSIKYEFFLLKYGNRIKKGKVYLNLNEIKPSSADYYFLYVVIDRIYIQNITNCKRLKTIFPLFIQLKNYHNIVSVFSNF